MKKEIKRDNDKENFIEKCKEVMNASTIYDRTLYKDKFKEIYNSEKYNFPLNDNIFSNIIGKMRVIGLINLLYLIINLIIKITWF